MSIRIQNPKDFGVSAQTSASSVESSNAKDIGCHGASL